MDAKKLYKKHLKLATPKHWISPKQMEMIKYNASIDAINEALEMGKIEKKKRKIEERIKTLQDEMNNSLTKKSSNSKEINLPLQQRRIQELKVQLSKL